MPAISGPFGPIVEPGWPATLPRLGNLGQDFVNAWATGQAIRNQRNKLEEQMGLMALRERQMEMNEQHRESEFELKKQNQDNLMSYRESLLGIRGIDEDRKVRALQDREQNLADVEEQNQGFADYILQKGLKPTDPGYPAALWAAKVLNPKSSVKLDSLLHNRNDQLHAMRNSADAELNHYLSDDIGTQYFGDKSFSDATRFLDPTKSERAFKTKPTENDKAEKRAPAPMPRGVLDDSQYEHDANGNLVPADDDPASRIIRYKDKLSGETRYAYFPGKKMGEIHDHLRELYSARDKIPDPVDIGPDLSKGSIEVFSQKQRDMLPPGRLYYTTDSKGVKHFHTKKSDDVPPPGLPTNQIPYQSQGGPSSGYQPP